jgi:TonB family protein
MKEQQKPQQAQPAAPRPGPAARGYKLAGFPKEFERNIWEDLDKRYYSILLGTWLFVYMIVAIFGTRDYAAMEMALNERIRQQFLKDMFEYEAAFIEDTGDDESGPGMGDEGEEPEEVPDERAERDQGKTAEARGQSAAERAAARRAAASQRAAARGQMEQAVAGSGILGVLSAGGSGGSGDAVADVLGDAAGGGVGDLDGLLNSVGGLAVAESGGQRSRLGSRGGGRATGSADVADLIQGIGSVGSSSIGRKGSIKLAVQAGQVRGRGSKSANRSQDAISTVINSHTDAIEACFKAEQRLNPNLKGDITVEFKITSNGRVAGQKITRSTLKNRKVEQCILNKLRGWRFKPIDKKEGDVTVRNVKYIFG